MGVDDAVPGAVRRPRETVRRDGDVPARVVGGQHLHGGAEAALERDRFQVEVPAVVGYQKEVTDVAVADLEAVPLAELAVDGQGVHGEFDVGPGGELHPHPRRAPPRGAERGGGLPLQDGDRQAVLGEVVRAGSPDDAGADDDDVGGVVGSLAAPGATRGRVHDTGALTTDGTSSSSTTQV